MTADNSKKKTYKPADNPIEQLKDTGVAVASEVGSVPAAIFDEALKQIGLAPRREPLVGEINLAAKTNTVSSGSERLDKKDTSIDAKLRQLQYVQKNEKEIFNAKNKVVNERIEQLMQQLQVEVTKLAQRTAELTSDVKKITVETAPSRGGVYYLNFLDMVIAMVRDLGRKVSESKMWLDLSSQKKKQKGYWAMFKKHGTNFAMSDERAIASANG